MSATRQHLEDRARELGCFPDPENYTDTQLLDAIKAEQAAGAWLARVEQLPTDQAKREAWARLSRSFYPEPTATEGGTVNG
jgi:hypothetical protein